MILRGIDLENGRGRVYLVDTLALGNARAVACYILVSDGKAALIDTGYASSMDELLRSLRMLNISPDDITYIVPTHLHLDHAGATGHLARLNRAEIVAHARAVKHLIDPGRLIASVREVFGAYADLFGYPAAVDPGRNAITGVESGREHAVSIGGVEMRCVTAEGHAPHQIAVYISNGNEPLLITADSVSMLYPDYPCYIPTTPPPAFDAEQAVVTAERLSRIGARMLLMPHFGVSTDPDAVFKATIESIREWVSMIRQMLDEGYTHDAVEAMMVEHVRSNAATSTDAATSTSAVTSATSTPSATTSAASAQIPSYVINSIRNSVKGIIAYLSKA